MGYNLVNVAYMPVNQRKPTKQEFCFINSVMPGLLLSQLDTVLL